jgi:membrane fusion protein, heavy metal efflux system
MKHTLFEQLTVSLALIFFLAGCGEPKRDPAAEAPPPAQVVNVQDAGTVRIDHPEQFPLATAVAHDSTFQLTATGTVTPDISRSVPVISIATGRVVEIDARLGDSVKKGQLLLRVQSADMSGAFSDYRKAVSGEQLARTQFERSKLLYDKGAISLNDLQVA